MVSFLVQSVTSPVRVRRSTGGSCWIALEIRWAAVLKVEGTVACLIRLATSFLE